MGRSEGVFNIGFLILLGIALALVSLLFVEWEKQDCIEAGGKTTTGWIGGKYIVLCEDP